MPFTITPAQVALLLAVLAVFAAMLTTLLVLGVRALRGDPVLRGFARARGPVPWGWVSVALVIVLARPVLPLAVLGSYEAVKRFGHVRIGPPPRKAAPARNEATSHNGPNSPNEANPRNEPNFRPKVPRVTADPLTQNDSPYTFTEQMFLGSVINAVLLVSVPLLLWLTSGARRSDLGLTGLSAGQVGLGLVAFLAVTPCVMLVNLAAVLVWTLVRAPQHHPLEKMLREGLTPSGIVLAYVSAVVLAPLAEEMVFRGVLQGWLFRFEEPRPARGATEDTPVSLGDPAPTGDDMAPPVDPPKPLQGGKFWRPIVLTSLLFAVVHAPQMPAPFAIFFLSLTLGWLMEVSGSLIPSVVLHAAFNGFNTTLMIFAVSMPVPEKDAIEKGAPPPARGASHRRVEKRIFRLALVESVDKVTEEPCGGR